MPGPGIAPEHVPSVDLERRGLGALRDPGRETAFRKVAQEVPQEIAPGDSPPRLQAGQDSNHTAGEA